MFLLQDVDGQFVDGETRQEALTPGVREAWLSVEVYGGYAGVRIGSRGSVWRYVFHACKVIPLVYCTFCGRWLGYILYFI